MRICGLEGTKQAGVGVMQSGVSHLGQIDLIQAGQRVAIWDQGDMFGCFIFLPSWRDLGEDN
jgi:hypothetical protein